MQGLRKEGFILERLKGIAMIIFGSMFWGATGPMMEWMLDETAMTADFMLAIRLIIAGIFILSIIALQKNQFFRYGKVNTGQHS